MIFFIILISSEICFISCMFSNGSYRAAVVEYAAIREPFDMPIETLNQNSEEYVKFIQKAGSQGASIIVFPEYGLTTFDVTKTKYQLNSYSIEIPNLIHKPNPCINHSMHKVLRLLSCAANETKMYVIANLLEKHKENGVNHFYSTDLIIDRSGTIITKYRKTNIYEEPKLSRGNELVTFTTDFGVTFGLLTGIDIYYKRPALEVLLLRNVTDIIYSSAWNSETPYLTALSVQAGYARGTGVNLLAAGLNDPSNKRGGSGIYLYDGKIAELYISPAKVSKLLVQDVPKIKIRLSAVKCNNNSHIMPRFRLGGNLNVGSFESSNENMSHYTTIPLNKYGVETKATLCNSNGIYCCKFHIVLEEPLKATDLKYKLSLFYGIRKMGETTTGIRWCGLVSCLNNEKSSCGKKLNKTETNVKFSKIKIIGKFERSTWNYDQPITLTHDFTPITEYTYCETLSDNKKQVQADMVTTQNVGNILSFGIHGRLYGYDGLSEGTITNSDIKHGIDHIYLVSLLVLIYHA